MDNPFKPQLDTYSPVTEEVLKKVEYRRVWSGELINVGDIVLYAFMEDNNGERRLFSLLDREVNDFSDYTVVGFENEIIPVLRK